MAYGASDEVAADSLMAIKILVAGGFGAGKSAARPGRVFEVPQLVEQFLRDHSANVVCGQCRYRASTVASVTLLLLSSG